MALHPQSVLTGLSVCAGIGGIELGLRLALGSRYRCAVYVEREAAAVATLVCRMKQGNLDAGVIWDDLGTFDGRPWRGRVHTTLADYLGIEIGAET